MSITMEKMTFYAQKDMGSRGMEGTVGDRINYLLRTHGRAEVGDKYTQGDLLARLHEKGVEMSSQAISRIVSGRNKTFEPEFLAAISRIFDVSIDWLVTGEESTKGVLVDKFWSEEANEIGALIDTMDNSNRQFVLQVAKHLATENNAERARDQQTTDMLIRCIDFVPDGTATQISQLVQALKRNRQSA